MAAPSKVLILIDGPVGVVVVFGLNWIGVLEISGFGGKIFVDVTWLVVKDGLVSVDLTIVDGIVVMTSVTSEVIDLVTVVGLTDVGTIWVEVSVVATSIEELGLPTEEETVVITLVPIETWQISEEHSVIVVKMVVKWELVMVVVETL